MESQLYADHGGSIVREGRIIQSPTPYSVLHNYDHPQDHATF